jgi:hypothetical protein
MLPLSPFRISLMKLINVRETHWVHLDSPALIAIQQRP